ncbi:hypothetical protein HAX54_029728 [Datura stramonium]|uniref:J domain-containing protein n=1 Tax=Datura stramonium TaxID=4076 RepID=A0ABS8RL00_DATST|nr:hypothetical protein [Datura stramonium]
MVFVLLTGLLAAFSSATGSLLKVGYREYNTAVCNQSRGFFYLNSNNGGSERDWLRLAQFKSNFGATRSIHGTATSMKDFYEVLGVNRNASASEIKKHGVYVCYPLLLSKEVSKAYEVLKDDKTREQYDQLGHDAFNSMNNGGGGGPGFDPFGG